MATVLAATVVARWFVAKRGLAMGALTAAAATGQLVFLPIIAKQAELHGWKAVSITIAALAIAVILLAIIAGLLIMMLCNPILSPIVRISSGGMSICATAVRHIGSTVGVHVIPKNRRSGMKYMIMLFGDEAPFASFTEEQNAAELEKHGAFAQWCAENGINLIDGQELQGSFAARTVRGDGTETDGPFLEIKEQLGGYYVIECANIEDAMEAARRCPNYGANEVRPVVEYEQG